MEGRRGRREEAVLRLPHLAPSPPHLRPISAPSRLGVDHRGNHVLLDHVDHAERLHLDGARVVVEQHRRARLALLLVEHAVAREEVDILRVRQPLQRVDARVDAPDARLGQRLLVGLVVVVAVEDDLPVLVERRGRNLGRLAARLDLVGEVAKRVGPDGAEDRIDERHVLRRANRAELEAVPACGRDRGRCGGDVGEMWGDRSGARRTGKATCGSGPRPAS